MRSLRLRVFALDLRLNLPTPTPGEFTAVVKNNKPPHPDHILLRPMRESDIAQVLDIERRSHFDAWDRTFLCKCLQSKQSLVIELQGKLAAYAVFSIDKNVTTLLNLTVAQDFRRHGLGRYLLEQVLKHSSEGDAQVIRLTVASSNKAAYQLYRSAGFKDVDHLHLYYQTRTYWEDAIVMEKNYP